MRAVSGPLNRCRYSVGQWTIFAQYPLSFAGPGGTGSWRETVCGGVSELRELNAGRSGTKKGGEQSPPPLSIWLIYLS